MNGNGVAGSVIAPQARPVERAAVAAVREVKLADGRAEPVCLTLSGGDALMMLHRPQTAQTRGTAVLICPPFGWQEVCAYRGLRTWARALAAAGYPAARLTLPSTGDSAGSPGDPGRVSAWIDATIAAADRLRALTGSPRVAAIGIELGGLIACQAQAAGAAIEDLVLWDVPRSGAALLREMRMFARIVDALYPEDCGQDGGEDLHLSGYPMSAQTARELAAIDLCGPQSSPGTGRRVLLLGRDGRAPDARLALALQANGAEVEIADGRGYDRLLAPPQASQPPWETISCTRTWLARGVDDPPGAPQAADAPELRCGVGGSVRETPLWFSGSRGAIFGVLSEPASPTHVRSCIVLLSSGGLVHTGPSRGWVELGRRWAARGVPVLRLDLPGIGEADGDAPELMEMPSLHAAWRVREIQGVLDQLQDRGVADRFVLGGACSGAYMALRAALADPRVGGLLLVNLTAFSWGLELLVERALRDVMTIGLDRILARPQQLRLVDSEAWALATRDPAAGRRGLSSARRDLLVRAARYARPDRAWKVLTRSMERRERVEARAAFDALHRRDVATMLFLSREEPLLRQLGRHGFLDTLDDWPTVTLERGGSRDHMYRAAWAQREVDVALDAAIERAVFAKSLTAS